MLTFNRECLSGDSELCSAPNVTRAAAGTQLYRPWLHDQLAGVARVGKEAHWHNKFDCLGCRRLEVHSRKSDELLSGKRKARRRIRSIELYNLRPAPLAGVGDREGHTCLGVYVHAFALQSQRAVFEGRVAETMAECNKRRGRHVEVALVDVDLGATVPTAGLLGVVDRHLSDVARERIREFSCWIGDAEDGVRERHALVRSGEVCSDDRRETIDDGSETLGPAHRHDSDCRLADSY